eukprot:jgi/Hompol1/2599/HPOL_005568-RA
MLVVRITIQSADHPVDRSLSLACLQAAQETVAAAAKSLNSSTTKAPVIDVLGHQYKRDSWTNVTDTILAKVHRRLHRIQSHPIGILKSKIETHLHAAEPGIYAVMDSMNPVVTAQQNFDDLLIAADHPGRQVTDTYYINAGHLLRTHTSAHQSTVLAGKTADGYLLTADVYRRDEIDQTHYPVFHQMEGIRTMDRQKLANPSISRSAAMQELGISDANPLQDAHTPAEALAIGLHLRNTLESLIRGLFANEPDLQWRWIDAYFPFTSPSWELEVLYNGKWIEIFGCGVIQQTILDKSGNADRVGWAFGLGLERIAMPLFNIPDIRLFWSEDPRFTSQFSAQRISQFTPFSKYPSCYKDISFWTPQAFHDNDFAEIVRDIAGDIAEEVKLFKHPKTGRTSKCFRINYRSMERTLTNAEIDQIQDRIRAEATNRCQVELR